LLPSPLAGAVTGGADARVLARIAVVGISVHWTVAGVSEVPSAFAHLALARSVALAALVGH